MDTSAPLYGPPSRFCVHLLAVLLPQIGSDFDKSKRFNENYHSHLSFIQIKLFKYLFFFWIVILCEDQAVSLGCLAGVHHYLVVLYFSASACQNHLMYIGNDLGMCTLTYASLMVELHQDGYT